MEPSIFIRNKLFPPSWNVIMLRDLDEHTEIPKIELLYDNKDQNLEKIMSVDWDNFVKQVYTRSLA
jgi:hypothetical protein